MSKVYDVITDRIISHLEQGVVPWRKPWTGHAMAPANATSRRHYRGINLFLLACSAFDSPYWLTFRQAQQLGGSVRKGEKGTPVVFWKWYEKEDKQTGEELRLPVLRYYTVFNVTQCDIPADKLPPAPQVETFDFSPIEACERVVAEMQRRPEIRHDSHSAAYNSLSDVVKMPPQERFELPAEYYSTLFHELVHSTGHASRLDRSSITDGAAYGSQTYGKEELIAEMGSAFLCGHCGIEPATLENSAAYINGWLKVLRSDNRLVVHAAANAQKAADFILGSEPAAEVEQPAMQRIAA